MYTQFFRETLPGLIRLNETCGAGGARATMVLTLKGIQLDVRPIENDIFFENSGICMDLFMDFREIE